MPEELTSRTGKPFFLVTVAELEAAPGWRYTHGGRRGRGACILHGGDNPTAMEANLDTGDVHCRTRGCYARIAEHRDTIAGRSKGPELVIGGHRRGRSTPIPQPKQPAPLAKPAADPAAAAALLEDLARWQAQLAGSPGATYLEGRGIPLDAATACGIGWGGSSGKMAGRVVFPLSSPTGQLTSATGRATAAAANPRYYTLPASTYAKTWFHGQAVHVAARDRLPLYVCEGPMDALALVAGGISTAVAVLGTSGIRTSWLADVPLIVACFDDDDAGRKGRDELAFAAAALGVPVQTMPAGILRGANDLADFWQAQLALPPELVAHWDAARLAAASPAPGPSPAPAPEQQHAAEPVQDAIAAPGPPAGPSGGIPGVTATADPRLLVADDWEDFDDAPALLDELEGLHRDADPDVPPDGVAPADWASIANPLARRSLKQQGVTLTNPRAGELCPDGGLLWAVACAGIAERLSVTDFAHLAADVTDAHRDRPTLAFWQAVLAEAGARRRAAWPARPRCFACATELVAAMPCRTCHPWIRPPDVVGLTLTDLLDDLRDRYGEGALTWCTQ